MRRYLHTLLALLLSLVILASCATFEQTVSVLPIDAGFPVSVSAAFLVQDRIYQPGAYRVIEEFSFRSTVESPVRGMDTLDLDLSGDLRRILDETGADALIDLKFQLVEANTAPLSWMSIASSFAVLGAGWLGYGIYYQLAEDPDILAYTISGGSTATLGLGAYVLLQATGRIVYVYEVSGKAVRIED